VSYVRSELNHQSYPSLSPPTLNSHINIRQRTTSKASTMSSTHKQTKPNEKHPNFGHLPLSTSGPKDCALIGSALLNTPHFNKGAGFTAEERKEFKLTGLLPSNVQSLEHQVKRAYQQYSSRQDDLAKNTFMTSMKEQNEVLFYKVSTHFGF
jgi:malate dehydrogenase (oxaloacetate-decarboxylating)